jgi:hypothetical protein
MERCKTCRHWRPGDPPFSVRAPDGGPCESPKFVEWYKPGAYSPDSLTLYYSEEADIWVGPDFGCVNHEPRPDAGNPER